MRLAHLFARLPRAFWWSLFVYVSITAWQGRDVLRSLGTHAMHDPGDPLLSAAILTWNARHLPGTQEWWNFPIFAPVPDALAFSEHYLGVTPISTPLYWLSGSGIAAYNLTALLTFPLCGAAMFLLVYHLTGSGGASFLAGLAYAFAPYRYAHLAHLQVLAGFWMPLALLGLHQYLDTGRRTALLLFAVAWFLQGAANGYYLVFFSVLVGLWVVWFVLLRGRWAMLWRVAGATLVAALPLLPILYRYAMVHQSYGFSRSRLEIEAFSADVAGVLCTPYLLQFWRLTIGCKHEGELFPGLTLPLVCIVATCVLAASTVTLPRNRFVRAAVVGASCLALIYVAIALSVWWWGRWRFELGPLSATASSFMKPFSVGVWAALAALALTALFGRIATTSTGWFYALAALVTWMMALGPVPRLGKEQAFDTAPYAWLLLLPGAGELRVPARFWMITVLCLAILMGLLVSGLLTRMRQPIRGIVIVLLACGLGIDSWVARIPAAPGPDMLWADRLAQSTVVEVPIQKIDTAPGLRAAHGGWRTANGYSGYEPPTYEIVRDALNANDGSILPHLGSSGVVNVTVRKDAPEAVAMVERAPGSERVAESEDRLLYRVPQQAVDTRYGPRIAVAGATASCRTELVPFVIDGDRATTWGCGSHGGDEELLLDLGRVATVGAIRHVVPFGFTAYPRDLVIDTSKDRTTWQNAWAGGVAGLVFQAWLTQRSVSIVLQLPPRPARYIRLRQVRRGPQSRWSPAEIEVYEPASNR